MKRLEFDPKNCKLFGRTLLTLKLDTSALYDPGPGLDSSSSSWPSSSKSALIVAVMLLVFREMLFFDLAPVLGIVGFMMLLFTSFSVL